MTEDQERDCIFCRGSDVTDDAFLTESGSVYVRWDKFPATPGHLHIVPKRHVESFFDLSLPDVWQIYRMLCVMRESLNDWSSPDGYNIGINDGPASGRSYAHLHVHLIPRYTGDCPKPDGGIRRGLPNGDPDKWGREQAHDGPARSTFRLRG